MAKNTILNADDLERKIYSELPTNLNGLYINRKKLAEIIVAERVNQFIERLPRTRKVKIYSKNPKTIANIN